MRPYLKELQFPLGGLHRGLSYQGQPPYTTPDALNVRPTGLIENRDRGGSRPGLMKAFRQLLGSGAPVNMINQVTTVSDDGFRYFIDYCDGDDATESKWTQASWLSSKPLVFPRIYDDLGDLTETVEGGVVFDSISGLNTSEPYTIQMFIVPWDDSFGGEYRIHAKMNNATPNANIDGVVANLVMADTTGAFTGTLKVYDSGLLTNTYNFSTTGSPLGEAKPGWFTLTVDGNTVSVYWNNLTLLTQDCTADLGINAGDRIGFSGKATVDDIVWLVDMVRIQYYVTSTEEQKITRLIASANGKIYEETFFGELEEVIVATDLNPDVPLQSTERYQKLFIADYGPKKVSGTSALVVHNGTAYEINHANITAASDIDINGDFCVMTNAQGAAIGGTYKITSFTDGELVLSGYSGGEGYCDFWITRAPKVYDPVAKTLTIYDTDRYDDDGTPKGFVPWGCPLITLFRDRIVFAGEPHNEWYMSRAGDPYDFDYFPAIEIDEAKAISGQNSEAGMIGDSIIAMSPHNDDYLVWGCRDSTWVMRGDPAIGGQNDVLSEFIGFSSPDSWCEGPKGELYFLSPYGLYVIPPGSSGTPQAVSEEKIPKELRYFDRSLYRISMEYDVKDQGIHIFTTQVEVNRVVNHFWYDLEYGSFWPLTLNSDHEPFALFRYDADNHAESQVLLGCRDGYIRRFYPYAKKDESNGFLSYITFGPIKLARTDFQAGRIIELYGSLGKGSNPVQVKITTGFTPEQSVKGSRVSVGSMGDGFVTLRPMMEAGSVCIQLIGSSGARWVYENMGLVIKPTGKQKGN